jgi:cytochrome c oxidase subunit 3
VSNLQRVIGASDASGASHASRATEASAGARPSALAERKGAHPEQRRDIAQLGMWIFLASELLFFGGVLFAYFYGRTHWPDGFAAASKHSDVVIGTLNTALLLTSSAIAALAVAAAEQSRGQSRWVSRCLWGTALLGLVFLGLKGVEWHAEWREGLVPGPGFRLQAGVTPPAGAELFFMLYFVMTGLHALHMLIGVGIFAVFGWRTGRPASADLSIPVEMAALYWHFVDIVWIVLYPLIYLVERHA